MPDDPAYDLGQGAGFYVNATRKPWAVHFRMYDHVVSELPAWAEWDSCQLVAQAREKMPLKVDQGQADEFLAQQLRPELLQAACAQAGHPLKLQMHAGYDHSHYFMASLMSEHLQFHAQALAHTATDLTVWDEGSNTLFTGDLLFVGHVPVVDGSVRGWLTWVNSFSPQRFARVVPGHGLLVREASPARLQRQYLQRLVQDTREAIKRGQGLQEAVPLIATDNLERWMWCELLHRRNVAAVYTKLEWE